MISSALEENRIRLTVLSSPEVKMFVCEDASSCELLVKEWMQNNPVSIEHVAQSQSERGGRFVFVLTVFYRSLS